jgi:hypothetical protein
MDAASKRGNAESAPRSHGWRLGAGQEDMAYVLALKPGAVFTESLSMTYCVFDKNGNLLLHTKVEKIARRLVRDNPERLYRIVPGVGTNLLHHRGCAIPAGVSKT